MFKSDCIALLGRFVLKIEIDTLERLMRASYSKLLSKISNHNMEDIYVTEEDPKQRTSQMKVQKLLKAQVDEIHAL